MLVTDDVRARFDANVFPEPMGGCWLWIGQSSGRGYGGIKVAGKTVAAHRLSWVIANGVIPDGFNVLHRCDNTRCVNPDHLFVGTQRDNMRDCVAKRRNTRLFGDANPIRRNPDSVLRGADNASAKLDEDAVRDLRRLAFAGASHSDLANRFGIGESTVSKIVAGVTWKHLTVARRSWRGENHRSAKLTEDDVREIRRLSSCGMTQRAIAERFGVNSGNVCLIVNRKAWKHVE